MTLIRNFTLIIAYCNYRFRFAENLFVGLKVNSFFSACAMDPTIISEKVNKIYINTGNLISCKDLMKRVTQTPSDEVTEALKHTLEAWSKKASQDDVRDTNGSSSISSRCVRKIDKDDRINLKLTVKVFLNDFSVENLNEAINEAMHHLSVNLIDSVVLALPNLPSVEQLKWDPIRPLWSVLEELVHSGKATTIGISDLNTMELMEVYNFSQVKPSVNQVNLDSCCVMPEDMTKFAKENDIQLLTHNDPRVADLFPKEKFESIFNSVVTNPTSWKIKWIVRYSVIVKCRGIVQNKGYLLCTMKDPI